MGLSRQEYWSGLPFPSPGDLPDSGIKAGSPALQADSLMTEPLGKTKSAYIQYLPDKILKSGRHISINSQYYIMTL